MGKRRDQAKQQNSPADAAPKSRRRRWVKPVCRIVSLLAVGLIVAHWYWSRSVQRALDEQIASYKSAGEPIYPADLNDPPIPDADNAVVELRLAQEQLIGTTEDWLNVSKLVTGLPLSVEQTKLIDMVGDSNRAAIEHLELATSKPAADWQMTFISPMLDVKHQNSPRVLYLSSLLRALALRAMGKEDGQREALRRVSQMIALSRIVDRQRTLTSHLSAGSIASLAAKTAIDIAPDVSLRSASNAPRVELIRQLLDDGPLREGQLRALYMTRVMLWDTAAAVAGGRSDLVLNGQSSAITGGRVGCYAIKPLLMSDGVWMMQYMSKLIGAAKYSSDWPEFYQNMPAIGAELSSNPRGHLIANRMLPDLPRYVRGQFRAITECRLAAIALAAHWYAQDHEGKWPASLADLKPGYLPYVPFDPMAGGGKPLRMGGAGDKRIVYSVGDDGVDDGGSSVPIDSRNAKSAGPWDRRDFDVNLTRATAATKPATRAVNMDR